MPHMCYFTCLQIEQKDQKLDDLWPGLTKNPTLLRFMAFLTVCECVWFIIMLFSRQNNITSEFQQDVIKVLTAKGILKILKGLGSE